tara:strand:+ start:158 stop:457 length:300 start_codon:yes stop_codon:yes gene_type:complete
MTDAERALWRMLREAFPEWRFRRQVPMLHYICDFASHCARLVIEVDGGQHGDVSDAARTHAIETQGYRVLRFWNNEVLGNLEGVYHTLAKVLHEIDAGR